MNERIQQILVVLATVGVIVFNWMAAAGLINNVTPEVISDQYPTRITPAGYAFAIWSLIYLGLAAFSIFQLLPQNTARFRSVRRIYIFSCVANCAWIYFWHHERILVCLAVICLLLGTLAFINFKLKVVDSTAEYWLAKAPFSLYFGWVTAAALVNLMAALVYLKIQLTDSTAISLGGGLILLAAALGVLVRIKLKNYLYPLAVAWALTAIAVKQSGTTMIVASAAVGVIACLIAALSFVMTMPSSENKTKTRA